MVSLLGWTSGLAYLMWVRLRMGQRDLQKGVLDLRTSTWSFGKVLSFWIRQQKVNA